MTAAWSRLSVAMVEGDKLRVSVWGFAVVRTTMMMMLRMSGLGAWVEKRLILSANFVVGSLVVVFGLREE